MDIHFQNFLKITQKDDNHYSFPNNRGITENNTFGGRILAQTYLVAMRSDEGKNVSSISTFFLSPGKVDIPMDYAVTVDHQGTSISFITILGSQNGKKVSQTKATLTNPGLGNFVAQKPFPKVPSPEETPLKEMSSDSIIRMHSIDGPPPILQRYLWVSLEKAKGLPMMAILAYLSDATLLPSLARYFGLPLRAIGKIIRAASVEHTMFFAGNSHPPWDNQWILNDVRILLIESGKAYITGDFFSQDGRYLGGATQGGIYRYNP